MYLFVMARSGMDVRRRTALPGGHGGESGEFALDVGTGRLIDDLGHAAALALGQARAPSSSVRRHAQGGQDVAGDDPLIQVVQGNQMAVMDAKVPRAFWQRLSSLPPRLAAREGRHITRTAPVV